MSQSVKVPFGQKVAFGVGMFANQMFPAILGIFMVVLVEDLKFTGLMWGMIYLFPRLFDAITDPLMGFISDNTKSKWGRRRQYVLAGGIVMGIAYVFMWQLFKENTVQYNFWYFFLWSVVFYLGLTLFSVPYVAMGYEMSDDFHERTNIMAIAQWIGQWAWVIAPLFWIIMYDPEWFPSADVAARKLAIWVAVPCAICAIVPALFIKSESTLDKDYEPLNILNISGSLKKILRSFVEAFRMKEFRKLCLATFFIYNAFMAVSSLTFFVIVYKLFNGSAEASGIWISLFGALGALGTTFIVIPVVAWLSKRMGKKKAFMLCQTISILGYIMMYFLFIPGKPWMYIIALPFFSFGIGSLFTIMMSMTADVIDIDELNTGKRREGIFGAIYWWMVKVGFAIAGALSGVIIWAVGFNAELPTVEQQASVDGLHAFFCFFPIIGTVAAMYVMRNYSVSEARANEIRAQLDRRKKPAGSSYYQTNKLASLFSSNLNIDNSTEIDFKSKSAEEIKTMFRNTLQNKMHGLCFSPYLEGQNIGDQLSENQIQQRMDIVAPYTDWIRSFSCTDGNELIPKVARSRRLKTMVGAWIGNDSDKNAVEIDNLIKLAKEGYVDVAVVGNEVLLREDLSEEELINNILKVKKALPDISIGYVDAYYQFVERPKLVEVCDVILVNCYPFWEGSSIKEASEYLRKMFAVTEQVANGKQVVITETGWPNKGDNTEKAEPSESNAMKYFINTIVWSQQKNIPLFYFSSFDESWKVHQEGDVGSRWGIWNKNEKLKY
ncbi:MFS transporter [Tenacibaculum aiptasiae]|uniref:MFS transporter n=1 Tax=Tenacibaculum aiptasiae TaxID=426481 RepID=UPI00232AE6CD|nr:MFS transporter [Tenacibaculum aiptasiae]